MKRSRRLVATAVDLPPASQAQVIAGLSEAFEGLRQVPQPKTWPQFANRSRTPANADQLRELSVLFGDGRAIDELIATVRNGELSIQTRQQALAALIDARPRQLRDVCLRALSVRGLNLTAAQGLALFQDEKIGQQLAQSFRRFHATDRAALLGILVSRPNFASALLDQIEAGRIPSSELSPFHARQIKSLNSPELDNRLAEVWGEVRSSNAEKQARVVELKTQLTKDTLAKSNLPHGRALFNRQCAQCHKLFGSGADIGPDLTGAQRASLDYLLENIVDPSAVVAKDHRMLIVETNDGRTFNGLLVSRNNQRLVLQTATEQVTLPAADVAETTSTPLSPMPDGLLDQLSTTDVADLIAYLMHSHQVELPEAGADAR